MIWCGLIECAVHVHRHVVTSRNYSCLRCKHAVCDVRSCSKCTSHIVENSSVDNRATGFTMSVKWHDCDRAALLLWHMFITKNAPRLWWHTASRSGHHMLDFPGNSSYEEKPSLAVDPAGDATLATTRDMRLPLVRGDAGGTAKHEQVWRKLEQNIKQHRCDKKGSWAETQEMGTWCDMDQTRHAKLPQECCQDVQCAWRQETQQNVAQGQRSPRSRGTRAVAEQRTPHHTTTIRTTHGAEH